ncbi:MAG TPA: serine/threonine-protein kinase, partial [Candidatus Acidoferrales bacterium]
MGVVYKARDPLIGRLVAMKTITSGLAEQPEMLERFYREAQAAGGLQHPNIVTIYDLGKEGNTPYIAMEFLEGISLEKVIEEHHPIPLAQRISYVLDVCRALDYAHRRGVVHRDIKPANIVITTDGTIKVVDFGIARLVDTSRSQTGLLIGTVNYMSPEQVRGERVDGRSDIFSVGVMFYELLTGQRPFTGTNFTAVMLAIITSEPKPIRELVPEIPAEIETVINKILRKDSNERYQALEEVLLDLEPVFRKMQQETVTVMVSESQQLIEKKELEKARDVLRQALLIDTSNRQAKTLLEKVNAELRRSLVVPKLKEMVDHATDLLKQGKLNEAR